MMPHSCCFSWGLCTSSRGTTLIHPTCRLCCLRAAEQTTSQRSEMLRRLLCVDLSFQMKPVFQWKPLFNVCLSTDRIITRALNVSVSVTRWRQVNTKHYRTDSNWGFVLWSSLNSLLWTLTSSTSLQKTRRGLKVCFIKTWVSHWADVF